MHRRILHSTKIQQALKERQTVLEEGRLLTVTFRSVEEYLAKLQLCAESLKDCQSLAIAYLAAAVSDFYIPKHLRSKHKIQSANGALTLELQQVPKVMGLLRSTWAPDAYICSFKLETDAEILRQKAERAVTKYNCHMVIGNLLHTRHDQVWILAPPSTSDGNMPSVQEWPMISVNRPKHSESDVLEGLILDAVVEAHFEYISNQSDHSGTEAVLKAHQALEEKKRKLHGELFWKQVRSTGLEWAGVAAGAVVSYLVSSALRRRMGA